MRLLRLRDFSFACGDLSSLGFTGAGGMPPFGSGSATYSNSGSSFQGPRTSSPCDRLNTSVHRIIRRHIAEHRISQLAHRIEGFHEHVGMRDLARQQDA